MGTFGSGYGFGGANVTFFHAIPQSCACGCRDPRNVLLKRDELMKLLNDARKLTHPDVCASSKATEITARLNACLAQVKPKA